MVRAAENDFGVAAAQEAGVAAALESAKGEALDLSRRGLKYDALKRDLEASQQLADSLLARQKQTDVARDVKASNVHVIDPAITPGPPYGRGRCATSASPSCWGSAARSPPPSCATTSTARSARPSDVRRLGLPLLGVIPETDGAARRSCSATASARSRSPRAIACCGPPSHLPGRTARARSFSSPPPWRARASPSPRSTSPSPSPRPKSACCSSTPTSAAPCLHSLLKLAGRPASPRSWAGRAAGQAIVRVPGSRLSLCLPGARSSATRPTCSRPGAFRDFLDALRARYDRVILDTPPAGAIADALILAPQADGVLVVARSGKVDRNAFVHLLERLANARAHLLGVVLNRARTGRDGYDYGPSFPPAAFTAGRCALPAARLRSGPTSEGGLS